MYGPDKKLLLTGSKYDANKPGSLYCMNIRSLPANVLVHTAKTNARSWEEWHQVLGHISIGSLKFLHRNQMVEGMIVDKDSPTDFQCEPCIQAQLKVLPFPKESKTCCQNVGDLTLTDVWGPSRTQGIGGRFRYYISFTDAKTRWTHLGFMRDKTEVLTKYKEYEAWIQTQFGKRLKIVRSDGGSEYVNAQFDAHLSSRGTKHEKTAPYSPQQNGIAERLNQTLVSHARAMLLASNLPKKLWPEALAYEKFLADPVSLSPRSAQGTVIGKTPLRSNVSIV
jgi:hypothetical protein